MFRFESYFTCDKLYPKHLDDDLSLKRLAKILTLTKLFKPRF